MWHCIAVGMLSKSHNFKFPLLFCGLILASSLSLSARTQDAIRIDVPAAPRVRIENRFGQVAAEAWGEKYVSVSATVETSGAVFKRSPVVIERKSGLLLISVIRRPTDPQAQISLTVKLPQGAYAEILSDRGVTTFVAENPSETQSTSASEPPRLANTDGKTKGAGTPASRSESEEVSEGDVIRVDSQLATLNLSVIDRNTSRGIVGLGQSDFRLFEDGVEQQILQFESSSALFDLMLLIDVSGSTRDVVKLIRAAALRFIEAARPSDRIGIISFAGKPTVVAPVTLDRRVLRERVNAIDTASGDTKAYDALYFSVSELLKSTRNTRRAAIVMMSDGLDGSIPGVQGEGSEISYGELLGHIREFDGVVYTLWLNTEYEAMNPLDTQPEAFDMGHDRMKETAEAGGGVFYRVERLEDLAGAYERVVADLGTVYSLAYRPTNNVRDGKWRSVRVTLSIPSAVARGKHGYYAK
jgi:VWFA-related protein